MSRGVYLYQRKNGYWYVGIRKTASKVAWVSTKCKDKPSALQFLRQYEEPTSPTDKVIPTIAQYIDLIRERLSTEIRPTTLWQYLYVLTLLKELIGDKRINEITVTDCELFKTARLKSTKPTSVNILLRALKAVLNRSIKWELLEKNPMMKVSMNRIPNLAPRFLTIEMLEQLNSVVKEPQLVDLFTFAAHTGCRLGEITMLRWFNVQEESNQFSIMNTWNWQTKSGKSRTIPIDKTVVDILNRQKERRYKQTTYIFQRDGFPLKKDYITHKFAYYRDKAKLPKQLHFHSLRHTAISWWLMSGISIYTVKEYSGHSSTELIDKIYGHLTAEHKQDEMKKLDVWLNKKGV